MMKKHFVCLSGLRWGGRYYSLSADQAGVKVAEEKQ